MGLMGRPRPTHIDDPRAFGARVRDARRARGLSLRDVAFPGCSPSFLSRVEAGDRVPSTSIVIRLADRLGTPVEALLGHRGDNRLPEAELSAAEVAARLGDADAEGRLTELLERARALEDRAAESRLLEGLGLIALDGRDDERAIHLLERARAAHDDTGPRARPALHRALGRAYAGVGDVGRSIEVLRAGFDEAARAPTDSTLLALFGTYLANAYTDAGQFGEAESVLARVISHEGELAPGNALRLEWALARTYAEDGRLGIAETYTRRILARLTESENGALLGKAHLLLAGVLVDQGRSMDAESHVDRSAQLLAGLAPVDRVRIPLERGRIAIARGDFDEAERCAREALDLTETTEPGHAGSAYAILAKVEHHRDNLDDARFLCRQAIEALASRAAPHYVSEAYETLAEVEEDAGDLAAALAALRARPQARTARG
jgi:tetratricopeptide (TPR) repeat protein